MQSNVGYYITERTSSEIVSAINMIAGITLEDKFNTLLQCNCCDRHQINKPKKMELWIKPYNNDKMSYDEDNKCLCNCRCLARFICRGCD